MSVPLENILQASSAVSFRILDISRQLQPAERMFQSEELNQIIIFKQPSFAIDRSPKEMRARPAPAGTKSSLGRPIQTAIFIPKVHNEPDLGGHAIFMGQPKYAEMMKHHCGIDVTDVAAHANDLALLRVLEDVPSFDPFLLKSVLTDKKMSIDEHYLNVAKEEEAEVRQVIEQRVRPIVSRAYAGLAPAEAEKRTQSFIDGIWDPNSSDATAFIAAFRVEAAAIPEVFGAWKGVSYYQYQLQHIRPRIAELLSFLQSDDSIPTDIRKMVGSERESLMMFRKDILTRLRNAYKNTQTILQECDQAYDALINDGNPLPFRDFLITAIDKYWTLGACNCALALVTDVWFRFSGNGRSVRYEGEIIKTMFAGMRAALSAENVGSSVN